MKKYIITLLILIGISGLAYIDYKSVFKTSLGEIKIQKNDIDLGKININKGKVDIKFSFKNIGNQPIKILEGSTSCMCTNAYIIKNDKIVSPKILMPGMGGISEKINLIMMPGETLELLATFDPLAHGPNGIGPIKRDVVLETDSSKTPEVIFSFQGEVVK